MNFYNPQYKYIKKDFTQASGSDYPHQYPGIDKGFNLEEFKKVHS